MFQRHVSLCAVDAAVPTVLELGFLATRESVCRNCASHGHGPTTAYYYYWSRAEGRLPSQTIQKQLHNTM